MNRKKMVTSKMALKQWVTSSLTTPPVDIVFIADKNHAFDFFIFSQQWPVTRCILLAEQNKRHICAATTFDEQRWIIHGIWPTRIGTKSPAFCNKRNSFDVHQLEPFVDELNEHWINIGNDTSTTSFWQHEWIKHGTCCAETELESEEKFFRQGLAWLRQFHMSEILKTGGISPGVYKVIDIHNVVYGKLNRIPSVHCGSTKDGNSYLSEIRLCFSKSLELIDCHVTGDSEVVYKSAATKVAVLTNCNLHRDIIYPDNFPESRFGNNTNNSWLQKFMDFLKPALVSY